MGKTIHVIAYEFRSHLSLNQVLERLISVTPWHWTERDSDTWGRYFSTRAREDYAMIKVYEGDGCFAVNIKFKSNAPDAESDWNALHDQVLAVVLPALDAQDVLQVADYD